MYHLPLILALLIQNNVEQVVPQWDRARIVIRNVGGGPSYQMPRTNAGPSVGNMLEVHFFQGVDHYNAGRYLYAQAEFAYVTQRPQFLEGNPRRSEYMSVAYYLAGMIYAYHAQGLGRRNVARENFEQAIQWNRNNYLAYIELARVFAELRFTKHAIMVIETLLQLSPPAEFAEQANDELTKLSSDSPSSPEPTFDLNRP